LNQRNPSKRGRNRKEKMVRSKYFAIGILI